MANENLNTVPLGEAGTGGAFILPQSQSINQAYDYIDQRDKEDRLAKIAAAKQAQQVAASWQKNRLNIKAGTLWQPEINADANDVMKLGIELQKRGINTSQYYNDPNIQSAVEEYNTKKQNVMSKAEARDEYAKQAASVDKMIDEDDGSLDPESIGKYHDFFNMPLSKIMSNGYRMPGVTKSYNMQKAIDALPTSKTETTTLPDANGVVQQLTLPNKDAHSRTAENFVNNTPQVRAQITRATGIPFYQIGDETDPQVIKQQLDAHYRSLPNIPSLAAQGVQTFGGLAGSNTNSKGIPDAGQVTPSPNAPAAPGTNYDKLITQQAMAQAKAAKMKQDLIATTQQQLNDKVGTTNNKHLNFAYQQEQDRRERLGMERQKFNKWAEDQQNEAGTFTLGNQNSYVPVAKQYVNKNKGGSAGVEPEKGASLYGVNLPAVETVVRPAMVTDMATGKTVKNTEPMNVKIGQIQMVPVYKGVDKGDFNGSEISARQLKEIIAGKNKDGVSLNNVTFQPYAYGVRTDRVTDPSTKASHLQSTNIKFSYDALKGSNVKKINTTTFDNATQELQQIQSNPKFQALTPQQKMDFLSQKYGLKLD